MSVKISKITKYTKSTTHPQLPGIVGISQNDPTSGYFKVESTNPGLAANGTFFSENKRVANIASGPGRLDAMVAKLIACKIQVGDDVKEKLGMDIKLIVKETLEPQFAGQEPKMNPQTAAVVTSGGKPIFRSTIAYPADAEVSDVLLQNDVTTVTAGAKLQPATEFSKK